MRTRLRSGTPMFACDADLRIVLWNEAAEKLTGIPSCDALGETCWRVMGGRADDGSLVCHQGCSNARLAREGWPVAEHTMNIRARSGHKRIAMDVISAFGDSSFLMLHILREAPAPPVRAETPAKVHLTPRQLEVLRLLDEGLPARKIAARLELSETTVRNHIRAVLAELGAHSQLQAVHEARKARLL